MSRMIKFGFIIIVLVTLFSACGIFRGWGHMGGRWGEECGYRSDSEYSRTWHEQRGYHR